MSSSGTIGIIDLMLSRSVPQSRPEELDHLVVELKAPKIVIGAVELGQVESYAFAVAKDERFRSITTRWTFWTISNDMDDHAKLRTQQRHLPRGVIYSGDDPNITICVKTWSEILQDCKARLRLFQEHLNYTADRDESLVALKKMYARYLTGTGGDHGEAEDAPAEDDANAHPAIGS